MDIYILIETDGYKTEVIGQSCNVSVLQKQMEDAYKEAKHGFKNDEGLDFCDELSSTVYDNKKPAIVWSIEKISLPQDFMDFLKKEYIKERQREGIERAKERGKYKGRKHKEIDDRFIELYKKYMCRGLSKVQFAKEYGVSRPTLDKLITRYKTEIL